MLSCTLPGVCSPIGTNFLPARVMLHQDQLHHLQGAVQKEVQGSLSKTYWEFQMATQSIKPSAGPSARGQVVPRRSWLWLQWPSLRVSLRTAREYLWNSHSGAELLDLGVCIDLLWLSTARWSPEWRPQLTLPPAMPESSCILTTPTKIAFSSWFLPVWRCNFLIAVLIRLFLVTNELEQPFLGLPAFGFTVWRIGQILCLFFCHGFCLVLDDA